MQSKTLLFSDGASLGNPGRGGWGAVILQGDIVTEIGGREDNATNNAMELTATIQAISSLKDIKNSITISTDSAYVVNGVQEWLPSWIARGWKTKDKKEVKY